MVVAVAGGMATRNGSHGRQQGSGNDVGFCHVMISGGYEKSSRFSCKGSKFPMQSGCKHKNQQMDVIGHYSRFQDRDGGKFRHVDVDCSGDGAADRG